MTTPGGHPALLVRRPTRAGGGHNSNPGHSSGGYSGSSGGHYIGGGGGGGYYSSGGGGGGSVLGGICCLLVVVVVVAVVLLYLRRKGVSLKDAAGAMGGGMGGMGGMGGGMASGAPPPPPPAAVDPGVDEVIAQIRQRDPAFDKDTFLNQASDAFYLVQKAWCDQEPAESRKVMADGVWVRHKAQMEELAAANKTNVLEELSIGSSTIVGANTDADNDTLVTRFYAVSRDYDVDKTSGRIVRGDRQMRGFQEDWAFQRSSRALTRPDGGTLSQKCPNCGAPLTLDNNGTCRYCKEMVMGGKHDWVLTRIEQVFA